MNGHSLITANRNTHAKIAFIALTVSAVFVALVAGMSKSDATGASPAVVAVKASVIPQVAIVGGTLVR